MGAAIDHEAIVSSLAIWLLPRTARRVVVIAGKIKAMKAAMTARSLNVIADSALPPEPDKTICNRAPRGKMIR
jgi:hypothetical protein